MKKIFRIICLICCFISLDVKANEKVTLQELDVYYVNSNNNTSNKQSIIYLDDKIVYRLDYNEHLDIANYQIGNIGDISLTEEELKQIELIGHYGYKYDNHLDYKYYLATQELIWETLYPNLQIYWTSIQYGSDKINVDKEKEEIMYYVNMHDKKLSINNVTLTFSINQDIILESDKTLKNYEVYDSGVHKVTVENGILHIITSKTYTGLSKIKLRKIKDETKKTQIYISENSNAVIYTHNNDSLEANFNIETKAGELTIKLLSEELSSPLKGNTNFKNTILKLYDENYKLVDEITLDESGVIIFSNMKLGLYNIEVVKSAEGYIINEDKIRVFLTLSDLKKEIIIKNDIVKSEVVLEKTYGVNYESEENAQFLIEDEFKNTHVVKTNKKGIANITLPYGKYKIKQIKGINNYEFIKEFEVNIDGSNSLINYKMHSDLIKKSITIYNKDKLSKNNILDIASFKIYDIVNKKYLDDIYITNEGILKIENIPLGKYRLEEFIEPYGYLKNSDLEFIVDLETNEEIIYYNEPILASIKVINEGIDYFNQIVKLDKTKFGIFAKEDIIINKEKMYLKDELIDVITINNGIGILNNLIVGKYYIKELEIIPGYIIDNKTYDIELIKNEIKEIKITNNCLINEVTINVLGIDNTTLNNIKLGVFAKEDVVINNKKYYSKDELIKEDITLDMKSVLLLPLGSFYVKQIESTNNYQLNIDEYCFEILDNNKINLTIYNHLNEDNYDVYEIPDTLVNDNNYYSILTILLSYLAIKFIKF